MKLENMKFFGYHGVFSEEKKLGQKFHVDLTLYLDLQPSGLQDDLHLTVNYADVYEDVRKLVEGTPFSLIEALAETIATTLLKSYTRINALKVKVRKPNPPFAIQFDGVVVELYRERMPR